MVPKAPQTQSPYLYTKCFISWDRNAPEREGVCLSKCLIRSYFLNYLLQNGSYWNNNKYSALQLGQSHDKIVPNKTATNIWIQSRKGYFLMALTVICFTSLKEENTPVVLCIRQDRGDLQSPFTSSTSTPTPILQMVA